MEQLARGRDGLTIEPKQSGPSREAVEQRHRQDFAEHFNFADSEVGDADSFDDQGRYNCGRCKQADGTNCALLAIEAIDREAGSCEDWEEAAADGVTIFHAKPPQVANYGVARNGVGFGCKRCPFASRAYAADSKGRSLYCGKGDFRTFENACCSINGAEQVPSESQSQARLMAGVAHDPAFAKKVGIPQSVGRDFNQADKGRDLKKLPQKKKPAKSSAVFGSLAGK